MEHDWYKFLKVLNSSYFNAGLIKGPYHGDNVISHENQMIFNEVVYFGSPGYLTRG